MTDEQRRLTFLRENVEHLEREKSELESLLVTLQRASEDDVADVMRILHTNAPQTLRSPPQVEQYQSLIRMIASAQPVELDEIVRRLRAGEDPTSILESANADTLLQTLSRHHESTPGMKTEFSGRDQFGLVKGAGSSGSQYLQRLPGSLSQPAIHWTSVTNDHDWIEHLLSLYFSWQHQFFQNFPEQLFRADMASVDGHDVTAMILDRLA
ncbi:putative c6 transcription factor protein [Neofusicoccum parvum UCRNP2]|uniref:Uncharacterized protein LTHEOB_12024 n=2 Tax=Neofusicoccum parvum TaxID=310453 RepID=A0ACB5RW11_9PEZI|nr:putative c6 transcription factor protein [Neofusicoccum parvum UCRNP2]GME24608.1 uncharacterized protein LTHEOB_12024 [Neofusicoccum parvum]